MASSISLFIVDSAVTEISDLAVHYGASCELFLAALKESLETIAAISRTQDGSRRYDYKLYAQCPRPPFRRCIMKAPFRLFIIFTIENKESQIHIQAIVHPLRATGLYGFGFNQPTDSEQ